MSLETNLLTKLIIEGIHLGVASKSNLEQPKNLYLFRLSVGKTITFGVRYRNVMITFNATARKDNIVLEWSTQIDYKLSTYTTTITDLSTDFISTEVNAWVECFNTLLREEDEALAFMRRYVNI